MTADPHGTRVDTPAPPRPRHASLTGLAAGLLGLALFIYFVRRAGLTDVATGVLNVGWGFLAILALAGLRFAIRAFAWTRCVKSPGRLRFRDAFSATLAGDALGNLTPLGLLISEPAKVVLVGDRAAAARALPALAVETLFYTMSVALMFVVGLAALLVRFETPNAWWLASGAVFALLILLLASAHGIIWRRVRLADGARTWLHRRQWRWRWLDRLLERLHDVEARIHDAYPRRRARLLPLALLETSFHAAGVAEIYVTLALIHGTAPTWLDAFLLESANRFITVAFKFVPLRIGVDEAGTGLFADLLEFGTTAGVTLAVVRKARVLVWLAVGVASLTRRGLAGRHIGADRQTRPDTRGPARPLEPTNAVIAIMARSPVADTRSIKTRLMPVLPDAQDRADLHAAFVADGVRTCRQLSATALRLAYTPEGGPDGFDRLGVEPHELMPQRGEGLGERERFLFEDLFAAGFHKAVIIGSDLPTLPEDHLAGALRGLEESGTVVLGPSADGGYYLMGLVAPSDATPLPDLFTDVRWSTTSALDDTVSAAHRSGIRVTFVPGWYDVDDEAALRRLRADLDDPQVMKRAPATAAVAKRILVDR